MAPIHKASDDDICFDASPFLRIHKDGRVERLMATALVPPGTDPETGVQSKDVAISESVGSRLYIPKTAKPDEKLPVLVYFHGGGFCTGAAWSPVIHGYVISLVSEANIVAVSVNYQLAPEHKLPTQYEESWAAIKWVAAHSTGKGLDPWLNQYADFDRMVVAGDSAGGNIALQMSKMLGTNPLPGVTLSGAILVHPFFWGEERIGEEGQRDKHIPELLNKICELAIPDLKSYDHPWLNPSLEPEDLRNIGCRRVLVCVAGADILMKDRDKAFYETLKTSGWDGEVEMFMSEGVGHVFHFGNPNCEQAVEMMKKVAQFINGGSVS